MYPARLSQSAPSWIRGQMQPWRLLVVVEEVQLVPLHHAHRQQYHPMHIAETKIHGARLRSARNHIGEADSSRVVQSSSINNTTFNFKTHVIAWRLIMMHLRISLATGISRYMRTIPHAFDMCTLRSQNCISRWNDNGFSPPGRPPSCNRACNSSRWGNLPSLLIYQPKFATIHAHPMLRDIFQDRAFQTFSNSMSPNVDVTTTTIMCATKLAAAPRPIPTLSRAALGTV